MLTELTMPALSPTMEEGTVAKWLVRVGDVICQGHLLAEIETDKATMEFESPVGGRVVQILIAEGTDDVAVGTILALVDDDDGAEVAETGRDVPAMSVPKPFIAEASSALPEHAAPAVNASPLALRLAFATKRPISAMAGSGPQGRVMKADLVSGPEQSSIVAHTVAAPVELPAIVGAARCHHLKIQCRFDPLNTFQGRLNTSLEHRGLRVSITDIAMKILALTLAESLEIFPDSNATSMIDIRLIASGAGQDLSWTMSNAQEHSVSAIGRRREKERHNAFPAMVLLDNLGASSAEEAMPMLVGESRIAITLGSAVTRPWMIDGEIVAANVLVVSGVFAANGVSSASAGRFLAKFGAALEDPECTLA